MRRRAFIFFILLISIMMVATVALTLFALYKGKDRFVMFAQTALLKRYQENFPSRLAIEKIDFHPLSHTLSLRNISIFLPDHHDQPRPITIEEITLRYDLFSLLKGSFVISSIDIKRPTLTLVVDEQGKLNLSQLFTRAKKDSKRERMPTPLSVILPHGAIRDFQLLIQGQKVDGKFMLGELQFSADLFKMEARAAFQGGRLTLSSLRAPLQIQAAEGAATLQGKQVIINSLEIMTEASSLSLAGTIDLFDPHESQLSFLSTLSLEELRELLPNLSQANGEVDLQGTLSGPLHHPLLKAEASMKGKRGLAIVEGKAAFDQKKFSSQSTVQFKEIELSHILSFSTIRWNLLPEGAVEGVATILSQGFTLNDLEIDATLSLTPPLPPHPSRGIPLQGKMTGHLKKEVVTFDHLALSTEGIDLSAQGEISTKGDMKLTFALHSQQVPEFLKEIDPLLSWERGKIDGVVSGKPRDLRLALTFLFDHGKSKQIAFQKLEGEVSLAHDTINISSLALQEGQGRYRASGLIRLGAQLDQITKVKGKSLVKSFEKINFDVTQGDLSNILKTIGVKLPLSGTVSGEGMVSGSPDDFRVKIEATLLNGSMWAQEVDVTSASLEISRKGLMANRFSLKLSEGNVAGTGEIEFSSKAFKLNAEWSDLPLEKLRSPVSSGLPLLGKINGSGKLEGTFQTPTGDLNLAGKGLTLRGQPLRGLEAQLKLFSDRIELTRLAGILISGETISARGSYRYNGQFQGTLQTGVIKLASLEEVKRLRLPISGSTSLILSGEGSLENPKIKGSLKLTGLKNGEANIGSGEILFETSGKKVEWHTRGFPKYNLLGTVGFSPPFPFVAELHLNELDLPSIPYQVNQKIFRDMSLLLTGKAKVSGDLQQLKEISGEMIFSKVAAGYADYKLENKDLLIIQLNKGMARVVQFNMIGSETDLSIAGEADFAGNVHLSLLGAANLSFLGNRIAALRVHKGKVEANLTLDGSVSDPHLNGTLLLREGLMTLTAVNQSISQIEAEIFFENDQISVKQVRGRSGGGGVEAFGAIDLGNFKVKGLNIFLTLDGVRVNHPKEFTTLVNGDLRFSGDLQSQLLSGQVRLIRPRYKEKIDLKSLLLSLRRREARPPVSENQTLQFDINIVTADPLKIETDLAKIDLKADLVVQGAPAKPLLLGRAEVEKGEVEVNGKTFRVLSGTVDFLNPRKIEPYLDVSAETETRGYKINVDLAGVPNHLNLHLASNPPLSEVDILALLTVGRIQQDLKGGSSLFVTGEVSSFLLGQVGLEAERGIQKLVGLDVFRVDPFAVGPRKGIGTKVTVGKDFSKNLTVTYSTIVGSSEQDIINVEYRLTENISLLGVRDERGELGLDLKFSFRFK